MNRSDVKIGPCKVVRFIKLETPEQLPSLRIREMVKYLEVCLLSVCWNSGHFLRHSALDLCGFHANFPHSVPVGTSFSARCERV